MSTMQDKIDELRRRQAEAHLGGGAERQERQREAGKLTARERVAALVDEGSFEETGLFATHRATLFGMEGKSLPADGVVTGAASIGGRLVHLASQDFTVAGGSAGEVHSIKVAEIMYQSLKTGSPFVFINDSGGARVQEGVDSLSGARHRVIAPHHAQLAVHIAQVPLHRFGRNAQHLGDALVGHAVRQRTQDFQLPV